MADVDQSLVKALIAGEDSAYAKIIDALYEPVYRFARKLCGEQSAAEDITQETFIAVWRGVGSFNGRSRFTTWVFGITFRQFLRLREKPNVQTVPLDEWQQQSSEDQAPDAFCELAHTASDLHSAIASLPASSQQTIFLIYNQGLTYREAAETLQEPVGTIKSRMNYAFKQLRERLGESEGLCNGMR